MQKDNIKKTLNEIIVYKNSLDDDFTFKEGKIDQKVDQLVAAQLVLLLCKTYPTHPLFRLKKQGLSS